MSKPAFAVDKLMEAASRRREVASALLRSHVAESNDVVIGSVLVDDTSAEWLCNDERKRWLSEMAEHRNVAVAWTIFSAIPGTAIAASAAVLARFTSIAPPIVALAAISIFIPILWHALRTAADDVAALRSLRKRGCSEISSHILEIYGGSVWMLGRKGLYFTCKPTPMKQADRKVNFIPYSELREARISDFPDSAILELMSWERGYVSQLVFHGGGLSKAEDAVTEICRCLNGPPPPGPRKRKRPPAKPGSSDPGFSLPAIPLYSDNDRNGEYRGHQGRGYRRRTGNGTPAGHRH
jgi:hypothetical protein